MTLRDLRPKVLEIIRQPDLTIKLKMQGICDLLQRSVKTYDWVGFYMAERERDVLKLLVQAGEPTDHTEIPFGKGICGQVAVSNENFLVPDVTAQDNYIACSIDVKSELVVPIFVNGENVGQIDIDSHTINAFAKADEEFLEFICAEVGQLLTVSEGS